MYVYIPTRTRIPFLRVGCENYRFDLSNDILAYIYVRRRIRTSGLARVASFTIIYSYVYSAKSNSAEFFKPAYSFESGIRYSYSSLPACNSRVRVKVLIFERFILQL